MRSGRAGAADPTTTTGSAPSASCAGRNTPPKRSHPLSHLVPGHDRGLNIKRVTEATVPDRRDYDHAMSDLSEYDLSRVALFPLPGVVLFPRAVLPLHIFEQRYRAMTADALVGDKLIVMALLRPGWQKSYYGRAEIEPVVCIGK